MKKHIIIITFLFSLLLLYCQTPEWLWASRAGGTGFERCNSIASDNSGNSYITGYFEGTADFGATTLISNGGNDIFIAKIDNNGNWLWAKRAGGSGTSDDYGNGIAHDNNGNIYVTGTFSGIADFGTISLTSNLNSLDIYVAKLDTNGNWLWVVSAGGTSSDTGVNISLDNYGNKYITGGFSGIADFGTTSITSNGGSNIYIAKLDINGNWLWAKRAGGTVGISSSGISYDNIGNCIICGYFSGIGDFGTISLTSTGSFDIFVAKLDANGNWLWAINAGGSEYDVANGVCTDATGKSYITGYFNSVASFSNISLTSRGDKDIFIAKLDTNGYWLWAKRAGGTSIDEGHRICIDSSGNSYVTGRFTSYADFGSVYIPGLSYANIFITKIESDGSWQWVTSAGGIDITIGYSISLDPNENVLVTGIFYDTTDFGNTSITSSGFADIYVAKLSQNGVGIDDDTTPAISILSKLYDAYPNPFKYGDISTIKTDIGKNETGTLSIFNIRGQCIQNYNLNSGTHEMSFESDGLASGIYFYRLKTQTLNSVKKLILLK